MCSTREGGEQYIPEEHQKKVEPISRRSALKKIGKVLGTIGGGAAVVEVARRLSQKEREPKTEAEKIFFEFPKEIPGIGRIEKRDAVDAKHVMVYIRQEHLVMDTEDRDSLEMQLQYQEDELVKLNAVQKEIYDSLSFLMKQYGINSVFLEGLSEANHDEKEVLKSSYDLSLLATLFKHIPDLETAFEPWCRKVMELKSLKQKLTGVEKGSSGEVALKKSIEHLEEELKPLDEVVNRYKEKYKYVNGGAALHFAQGHLDLKPAEDSIQHNEAIERMKKRRKEELNPSGKKDKDIHRDREDVLVERISLEGPISVSVFGAGHDFTDSMDEWNKKHPNEKVSIITLTPETRLKNEKGITEEARIEEDKIVKEIREVEGNLKETESQPTPIIPNKIWEKELEDRWASKK